MVLKWRNYPNPFKAGKKRIFLEQRVRIWNLVLGWVFPARIVVFPFVGKEREAGNATTLRVQPTWKGAGGFRSLSARAAARPAVLRHR